MFRPRILYVINSFAQGGAERGLVELVRQGVFFSCDLRVAILAEGSGSQRQALEALGVQIVNLSQRQRLTLMAFTCAAIELRRMLITWQPDALILSLPQANLLGRMLSLGRRNILLLSFEHNTRLAKCFYEWGYWLTSTRIDWLLADAEQTAQRALQRFYRKTPERLTILPLVAFAGAAPDRPIWTMTSGRPFKMICVGRLATFKNHLLLLEAVNLLRQLTAVDFKLTIYGEGDQRSKLEDFIREHRLGECVHLAGHLENWAAEPADLYILPSRHEGLSIATLEAMFAGIPVLASQVGELVNFSEAVQTLQLEELNAHNLALAIDSLINSPARRADLQALGRSVAIQRYGEGGLRAGFNHFNETLRQVLEERRSANAR